MTYDRNPRNKTPVLQRKVEFSPTFVDDTLGPKGDFNLVSVLPLTLLGANALVVILILMNTLINKFRPGFKLGLVSCVFYVSVITVLCWFCIEYNVAAGDG